MNKPITLHIYEYQYDLKELGNMIGHENIEMYIQKYLSTDEYKKLIEEISKDYDIENPLIYDKIVTINSKYYDGKELE